MQNKALPTLLLAVALTVAFFGGPLAPHEPTTALGPPWQGPGGAHPLGTDGLGRDVWSRTLAGGGQLLAVSAVAAVCASALGLAGGLVAGWFGGLLARLLNAAADLLLALPSLLLALVAALALPWPLAVTAAAVCGGAPLTLRVVHDAVRTVATSGYVEAARLRGEHTASVLVREVLPSLRGLVAADLGLRLVVALQVAAALNVLGLGAAPPAPDWAAMLRENMTGVGANPWAVAAPATALGVTTVLLALLAQIALHRDGPRRPGPAAKARARSAPGSGPKGDPEAAPGSGAETGWEAAPGHEPGRKKREKGVERG